MIGRKSDSVPMTVIVTRNVEARYRGFLASAMLEVAPGLYVSPNLSKAVRERIWSVLAKWYAHLGNGAITLCVADSTATGGLKLDYLGDPPKEIWDADGVLLVRHSRPAETLEDLPF